MHVQGDWHCTEQPYNWEHFYPQSYEFTRAWQRKLHEALLLLITLPAQQCAGLFICRKAKCWPAGLEEHASLCSDSWLSTVLGPEQLPCHLSKADSVAAPPWGTHFNYSCKRCIEHLHSLNSLWFDGLHQCFKVLQILGWQGHFWHEDSHCRVT